MNDILNLILVILLNAVVILIVGRLGLGLTVAGFVPAIVAAVAIAIISWAVLWLLNLFGLAPAGGWWGALISLVVAAVVLLLAGGMLPGLAVNGFVGALVAAVAIGVVAWLVNWVLGLFGIGVEATVPAALHLLRLS